MTETLLSPSNILLFGRVVEDLEIKTPSVEPRVPEKYDRTARVVTTDPNQALTGLQIPVVIDGVTLVSGNNILVGRQGSNEHRELNGLYKLVYSREKQPTGSFERSESMNRDDQLWEGLTVL